MWTRYDLKMRGREAFLRNYWASVVVALVMSVVAAVFSATSSHGSRGFRGNYSGWGYFSEYSLLWAALAGIAAILGIGLLLLAIFVGNVLIVGGGRYFVLNQTEMPTVGYLGYGLKTGQYGNIVLVMFLRDLFTFLWTLLFVVPGIIKHYEYLMVPYILAENPGMGREEAFLISKKMMMGQKWEVFVLDLSFLGWRILEYITFGIVGIFYVEPYYQGTMAELYSVNRTLAYQNGYIR